jgi:hypothetical protein
MQVQRIGKSDTPLPFGARSRRTAGHTTRALAPFRSNHGADHTAVGALSPRDARQWPPLAPRCGEASAKGRGTISRDMVCDVGPGEVWSHQSLSRRERNLTARLR